MERRASWTKNRRVPPGREWRRARRPRASALIALALLLVGPMWALGRVIAWIQWWILVELVGTIWVVTCVFYHNDKLRAEAGEWRIPESVLHFWELAGGWPAAFLAQRAFRHKIAKRSYQATFWGIVSIHEYVAIDSLLSWRLTNDLVELVRLLV
jgi:uncharacterized membrane protein YsdA (DUF1294 family)